MAVTFHPNGSGPYNLQIWSHGPPYTAAPVKIREWLQGGAESPGPFGYCTLECMFDGGLWIGAAGGVQSASSIVPATIVVPGICPPFAPQGVGQTGPMGPQGPQGPAGAPGSGGSLSPEQAADLAWLSQLRAVLSAA